MLIVFPTSPKLGPNTSIILSSFKFIILSLLYHIIYIPKKLYKKFFFVLILKLMGAVASVATKIVFWVGNCIAAIITWWKSHKDKVNKETLNYLINNKNIISQADDPKTMCELLAIRKEKGELEVIASRKYYSLSLSDKNRIDALLMERDY